MSNPQTPNQPPDLPKGVEVTESGGSQISRTREARRILKRIAESKVNYDDYEDYMNRKSALFLRDCLERVEDYDDIDLCMQGWPSTRQLFWLRDINEKI